MELLGVWQAAVIEPELLIETLGIDNHGVALPGRYRTAVVQRIVGVAIDLADLLPPVGVDHTAIAVSSAKEHQNAVEVGILHELEAVNLLPLAGSPGGLAGQVHGVIPQEIALAVLVHVSCPFLHGSDFIDVGDILEEAVGVHFDLGSILQQRSPARISPISSFARRRAQSRLTAWPTRYRSGCDLSRRKRAVGP